MKLWQTNFLLAGIIAALLLFLAGCYTQLGVVRNGSDDTEYTSADNPGDSSYAPNDEESQYDNNYSGDWGYYHPRIGFSYYYPPTFWPSVGFSIAYENPWAYDAFYSYDPWYSWYGYGYPYSYYPSYYPYYPAYSYPYYGYGYAVTPVHHGPRTFGATRAIGGNTGTRASEYGGAPPTGVSNLPAGVRVQPSAGGTGTGRTNTTSGTSSRSAGNTRASSTRAGNSGTISTSVPQPSGSRDNTPPTRFPDLNTPQPAQTLPPAVHTSSSPRSSRASGHRSTGHSSRTAGATHGTAAPSYSPPASTASPSSSPRSTSSAPASSSGSGSRSGSSSSGSSSSRGGTRGGGR